MRAERWWQNSSVIDQLFNKAGTFEFIQTTRLLRHVPYLRGNSAWADTFKFEPAFNLSFPASEVEQLEFKEQHLHLTNLVVGLTGVQGALPYAYTCKVKQGTRQQRLEVKEFLGLFNHKLAAQYVDSSISYNLPIRYEVEQENRYLDILHALNGYIRTQHQQTELDEYFAEFAGLMQGQNNTPHVLKTMLSCIFKQNIHIREFIRETFKLADEQKTCLNSHKPSLLGLNTFCGDTVQQVDGKIEIQIGPMKRAQYLEFLPQQPLYIKLKRLVQSWCSPTLFIDVRLILDRSEIEATHLEHQQSAGLGQGSFLMPPEQPQHNYETCYSLIGAVSC